MVTYHLKLPGHAATFDYAEALYFATYGGAVTITANSDAWSRMRRSGAATVSCTADERTETKLRESVSAQRAVSSLA